MFEACPIGERRTDIREAIIATNVITATSPTKFEPAEIASLYERLRDYLKCHAGADDDSEEIDHAALQKVKDATQCRDSAT